MPHIVFTGGGTGGHLFPGIAVARRLTREGSDIRVTFAGSGKPFERTHVEAAGFLYLALRSAALPRGPWQAAGFLRDNLAGYRAAKRFLATERVDVVVGLGGFASAPMARAAVQKRIPLVLLEQNAVPGRVTRWLAPSATLVCTAFETAGQGLRCGGTLQVTGNPVDPGFVNKRGQPYPRSLLILGGSGGARALNENVPPALAEIRRRLVHWNVVHQSGPDEVQQTRLAYQRLGLAVTVVPFIAQMPSMLAETDLAVCRAGGTTLAELALAGVPAVLVPYPHAKDDHQRKNAEAFRQAGACLVVDQQDTSASFQQRLADTLQSLLADPTRLATMSRAQRQAAHPEAARDIAAMVHQLVVRPAA